MTADGCEVITRFLAEDLVIAGKHYYTAGGALSSERETLAVQMLTMELEHASWTT